MAPEADPDVQMGPRPATYSIPSAAKRLSLHPSHLYALVKEGRGPERAPGYRQARFTEKALDAFAATRPPGRAKSGPKPKAQPRKKPGPEPVAKAMAATPPPAASPTLPAGAIDWSSYAAYAPRVVDTLEGAHAWPAGVYLTPLGVLVRLGGPRRR